MERDLAVEDTCFAWYCLIPHTVPLRFFFSPLFASSLLCTCTRTLHKQLSIAPHRIISYRIAPSTLFLFLFLRFMLLSNSPIYFYFVSTTAELVLRVLLGQVVVVVVLAIPVWHTSAQARTQGGG